MKKSISAVICIIFLFSSLFIAFAKDDSEDGITLSAEERIPFASDADTTTFGNSIGDEPSLTAKQTAEVKRVEAQLYEQYSSCSSMEGTGDYAEMIHRSALYEVTGDYPGRENELLRAYDNETEITLNPYGSTNSSFTELFTQKDLQEHIYGSGNFNLEYSYFVIESTCTDGEHLFAAVLERNNQRKTLSVRLVGLTWNAQNQKYDIIYVTKNDLSFLHHANDMAYNFYNNEIIILCSEEGMHNMLYSVPADDLLDSQYPDESLFSLHYISCRATSIDYNKTENCYYIGITGRHRYFVKCDSEFNIISDIGDENVVGGTINDANGWGRHTVFCDDHYLYALCTYYNGHQNKHTWIDVYKLNGDYIQTLSFVCEQSNYTIEGESLFYYNGTLNAVFNYATSTYNNTTNGYCKNCYVDLSSIIFNIEYCEDESMTGLNHEKQFIIREQSTPLLQQRITKNGKRFVGWTAYRQEVNKWYYRDQNNINNRSWYVEGSQPSGYIKYVYSNKKNVSQTGLAGEHVFMCAQWEDDSYFSIDYFPEGGTGTMDTQRVLYGMATPLYANLFQKTGRVFQGWNVYWVEKNKWYYQSADGQTRHWYVEGTEDPGYKKCIYSDCLPVSQTAYAGGHIEMHALWNEFTVFYNLGQLRLELKYNDTLSCQLAVKSSEANNVINKYINTYDVAFQGWILYNKEKMKCLYVGMNSTANLLDDYGWYKQNTCPDGFVKYVLRKANTMVLSPMISSTADPGDHLILYAVW